MANRITAKQLEHAVNVLNRELGFTGKVWNRVGNDNVATVGMLMIDSAYNGYKIVQIVSTNGAVKELTHGYKSAREVLSELRGIETGLELAMRKEDGVFKKNPRKLRVSRNGAVIHNLRVGSRDPRKMKRVARRLLGQSVKINPRKLRAMKASERRHYKKNPKKETKQHMLQEYRNGAWHTLATMTGMTPEAMRNVCVKYAAKHPDKKLRLFS